MQDTIRNNIKKVFTKYRISSNSNALRKIVLRWAEQKSDIMALLSRHPLWNPENLSIVDSIEILSSAETCASNVLCLMRQLSNILSDSHGSTPLLNVVNVIRATIYTSVLKANIYITDEDLSRIKDQEDIPSDWVPKKGQKITRYLSGLINTICENSDTIKAEYSIEECYTQFVSTIPDNRRYKITLSAHPCDYLNMSNGNSWSSCHRPRAAYGTGTLSYMLDEVSLVASILPSTREDVDLFEIPKIYRQMVFYKNGFMAQSRVYPGYRENDIRRSIRHWLQEVFATIHDVSNRWVFKYPAHIYKYASSTSGSSHFKDYDNASNVTTSKLNGVFDKETHVKFLIGHKPMCLYCGNTHTSAEKFSCDCTVPADNEFRCYQCRYFYPDGDCIEVGEHCYCRSCVRRCESCNEYTIGDLYLLGLINENGIRRTLSMCHDCYESNINSPDFITCYDCNARVPINLAVELKDTYAQLISVCPGCKEGRSRRTIEEERINNTEMTMSFT